MDKVSMHEIDSTQAGVPGREINIRVHYEGCFGNDYTLCGVGPEEDDRYPDGPTATNKRVDCVSCIQVRDYVKGVSA